MILNQSSESSWTQHIQCFFTKTKLKKSRGVEKLDGWASYTTSRETDEDINDNSEEIIIYKCMTGCQKLYYLFPFDNILDKNIKEKPSALLLNC